MTTAGLGVAVARPDVTRCELGVEASAPSVGEALGEAQRALVRSVDGAGDIVSAALGAAGDRARLHGLQAHVTTTWAWA